MTSRINAVFEELAEAKRSALITYIMAGDPDLAVSLEIMKALPAAGADIIELGLPFSDPMADGPTIQAAALRALKSGATTAKVLQQLYDFRQTNKNTPVILMGYYNPIFHYGVAEFCEDAKAAGADGFIIVDLPPEEDSELFTHAQKHGLSVIRLVAPTTKDERMEFILSRASGFVYYVSMAGITGAKAVNTASVIPAVQNIKEHTKLPVCVGFGIKTAAQAKDLAKYVDGVVIGSAIVEIIGKNQEGNHLLTVDNVYNFVEEISKSLK